METFETPKVYLYFFVFLDPDQFKLSELGFSGLYNFQDFRAWVNLSAVEDVRWKIFELYFSKFKSYRQRMPSFLTL